MKASSLPAVQRVGDWKTPDTLLGIYAEAITPELAAAVELVGRPEEQTSDGTYAVPTQAPAPATKAQQS